MIPEQADVVVVGGGIIGCSIAYHLAKLGIGDTVLLERRRLCCGTTWHSVGSVAELRRTRRMTELARYSAQLYRDLEAETGQATGYRKTGSIMLATDRQWLLEMNRIVGLARSFGQDADIISAAEVRDRCPHVRTDDVLAGLYLPTDGRTNPIDTTQALAKGARMNGARIFENVEVTGLLIENGRVRGVMTGQGPLKAEVVVLATGMWGREFGARHGVSLPLQAAEHFYAVTENIKGLQDRMPFIRVPSEETYYKEDAGKLLFGCLEKNAKPWGLDGIPREFCFDQLPEDLEHFGPILEAALERFPLLQDAGIQLFFNGPESFTPDGNALLGETPEIKDLFVAGGMNTVGVMSGGAIGKVVAEWIRDRERPEGLESFDIARFSPFQSGRSYMRDRTIEAVGVLYDHAWPNREYATARGARLLPLHGVHLSKRAVSGERAGWEIPLFYAPKRRPQAIEYSYDHTSWMDWVAEECRTACETVGLFDGSACAVVEIFGPDACALADYLSAGQTGKGLFDTLWLTAAGSVCAMVRELRTGDDTVLIMSNPGSERLICTWIERHATRFPDVTIGIRTSAVSLLVLAGKQVPALFSDVTSTAPASTVWKTEIGYAPCRAAPLSGLGVPGLMLLVPSEFSAHAYETLTTMHGADLPLIGAYASNALRIENGILYWQQDVDDTVSAATGGILDSIDMNKAAFVGKSALLSRIADTRSPAFVQISAFAPSAVIWGSEPILRNGEIVGMTTSGAKSSRSGNAIGLGIVNGIEDAKWIENAEFTVLLAQGTEAVSCVPITSGHR